MCEERLKCRTRQSQAETACERDAASGRGSVPGPKQRWWMVNLKHGRTGQPIYLAHALKIHACQSNPNRTPRAVDDCDHPPPRFPCLSDFHRSIAIRSCAPQDSDKELRDAHGRIRQLCAIVEIARVEPAGALVQGRVSPFPPPINQHRDDP